MRTRSEKNPQVYSSGSSRLIEDETFNHSDIMNSLIDYEDGQEPASLRVDKNKQGSSFPTKWKSIFINYIPIKKEV
ncbi:hypothetical protein TNCV_1513761 [Trichonephila clavipes]|nr:hypothetical protein TNCV_1513761 [Trichonephila clavipes]